MYMNFFVTYVLDSYTPNKNCLTVCSVGLGKFQELASGSNSLKFLTLGLCHKPAIFEEGKNYSKGVNRGMGMMTEAGELLRAGMEEIGFRSSEKQISCFLTYLEDLKKWNRAYNLTGLKTDRDIIIKHFLDSLLFAHALPTEALTLADIGSGAGFPGIPIKIMCPNLSVFLIEPTQKKAVFLQHICSKLQLKNIEIIDKRIEEVKGLTVDVAVTRALFSIRDFIEKTKDILNKKGVLILSKGPGLDKELAELPGQGLTRISRKDLSLPFGDVIRHIVIVGQ